MKKTVLYAAAVLLSAAFLAVLCEKNAGNRLPEITEDQIPGYLLKNGWETEPENIFSRSVTIPYEFNEKYRQYNRIQKEQGFDLSVYKGKKAVLVTCPVTNYCEDKSVYAELILADSEIIGAALVSDCSDGFIKPLNKH